MARYTGRHSAKHAAPRKVFSPAALTSTLLAPGIARPAVGTSVAMAVVATTAAGFTAVDADGNATSAFMVSPEALTQANELSSTQTEDVQRLAADRTNANTSRSVNRFRAQEEARKAAEARAKAAREAAEAAARERARKAAEAKAAAERARLIANAQNDPRGAARALLADFGFDDSQWSCLDQLWQGESGWNYLASNPSSGAYGIPQSLPGNKMATMGSDWQTNPITQIKWGLNYISEVYGTPCGAWDAWNSRSPHWY